MNTIITLIVIIILQCVHVAKHHKVYLIYMQFLFLNYTSIKLGVGQDRIES